MVSDQELANGVASVLRQADPNVVTSVNGVVKLLEAKLGLDLSHKTAFIRDQIDHILRSSHQPPPKDHFALQHHPQFQSTHPSIPSPFPPQLHQHDLRFPCPPLPSQPQQHPSPPQPQQHQHPSPIAVASAPETPKESTQTGGKRRGGPGGLNKVCGVSPELQTIVGEPALPRTEIVKQLWAYIRKNNLQDPSNKRKIICNDALRLVFETDCTDMFKMNKLLAKHIIPLGPTKDSAPDPKRLKAADVEPPTKCAESSPPVIISDALAKFFGTGEREMLQSEAVRRVWDYVRVNRLEDPLNAMVVVCDSKLQELFGCESLSALGISQMLVRHFYRRS